MTTKDYWHRQTAAQPLFPELEWSKPENKLHAGKLLIVGGNAHGFAAPATAYNLADKAGAGSIRVLLPQNVQKIVGNFLPNANYGVSTPSGSFATGSLSEWLDIAGWADMTLLAGDFGRNSETAIVLEKFVTKHTGPIVLTKDAIDYFSTTPKVILDRQGTTIVASFAQLQKLATNAQFERAFTFKMDFLNLVDTLHELTTRYPVRIVTKHLETIFVADQGRVSTTKLEADMAIWRVEIAARSSVWLMQHAGKSFEALTTAVVTT